MYVCNFSPFSLQIDQICIFVDLGTQKFHQVLRLSSTSANRKWCLVKDSDSKRLTKMRSSVIAVDRPATVCSSHLGFREPRILKTQFSPNLEFLHRCFPASTITSHGTILLNLAKRGAVAFGGPRISPRDRIPPARAPPDVARSFTSGSSGETLGLREPSVVEFITSERVKVVAMLGLALALCNADRVVMSVAIVPLSLSHGWRHSFAGIVQSSFLWGYLISPVAGGTLVDFYGGKVVMAWGVGLWSLATFLTPWAAETSLWSLLLMRVLLGVAEGVALPCMNNMIARWFPKTERSRAVGLAMAGFQLGSAIGLTLSPILMSQGGVFGPFVIFGLSGFLWVLVWVSATSSTPEQSTQISEYELEYIQSKRQKEIPGSKKKVMPPFRRLLSKLPTWSLIVANAMHSWGFFVILSWMPIYFKTIYHVDLRQAAWFSAVPWTMMAVVGYFGGVLSDKLIQKGLSITLTRKIMQSIGFMGPGAALVGLTTARTPTIAAGWLTLAVGLKSFSHSGFLVNLQEIAPQYSGVLHGISNTAGTFAAILGTVGAGFFVEWVGSFGGFILLTSLLYFCCAIFYSMFSTGERVNFD